MADFNFGRNVGEEIAENIGVGIDENSLHAITAMENLYIELDNLTKNAAKNAEKYAKARQERELKNLKNSQKLGLISEREYYEKLREYRDKNLRQGSDEWYKYTEEIIFYNKRLSDEVVKEQQKMAEKVLKLQTELSEKLKTDDAPWFQKTNAIFRGMGTHGGDLWFSKTELDNFNDEILLLERYNDAITKLKALGNVPLGVFSDIAEMDVSEGLSAALAILGATDKEREAFLQGHAKRESLADSISQSLNPILNAEALMDAGILSAEMFNSGYFKKSESGETEFLNKLYESFEYVPESYFTLGGESAKGFGDGFLQKIGEVMEEIKAQMAAAAVGIGNNFSSVLKSSATESGGDHRTYNNTYTFNASKDTTTEQLRTAKNAAILARLRGGE